MCTPTCLTFAESRLVARDVEGRAVLEVGSADLNGSVRRIVSALRPASYLGVDLEAGPGVDEICDVVDLVKRYGRDRFDVVISTELLEHVRDWRRAVSNLKNVLKPGGVLLVTTRSQPFYYHRFPHDYWRYEVEDVETVFGDLVLEAVEKDPIPGVLVLARKPAEFRENDLSDHALYSMVRWRRTRDITDAQLRVFRWITNPVYRFVTRMGRSVRKRWPGGSGRASDPEMS